ncbi:olfactory receptor 14A16-like, partial [Apteryx mantelli]|uniref:Olfactory receptor 14A16-like n=1 Tax=Apteryx mantelli TaxID=2696672 RepID=A0ABM4F2I2_9AVES
LHYSTLMGSRACVRMAAAVWGTSFLNAALHTANTFSIPLCQGNTVDQFFCEVPQILKLSCSESYLREVGLLVVSLCLAFGCFVFIVLSYVQIFTVVLRMPSEQGRHKAFSTCIPHLVVVSLFVSTGIFAYLKPPSISSPALDLVVTVLYSVHDQCRVTLWSCGPTVCSLCRAAPLEKNADTKFKENMQSVDTLKEVHGAEPEVLAVLALHMAWEVAEEG